MWPSECGEIGAADNMVLVILNIIFIFLQLVELIIIWPVLWKRRKMRKHKETAEGLRNSFIISTPRKFCVYIELGARSLIIVAQLIIAVYTGAYSFWKAVLIFGVGQIYGRGIGAVITGISIYLLLHTHKIEQEKDIAKKTLVPDNRMMPISDNTIENNDRAEGRA